MKPVSVALFAGMVAFSCVQPVSAAEAATWKEKVLYSFCSQQNCTDGANPFVGLIAVKGKLYGTTFEGGVENSECENSTCGTVYSVDRKTGAEQMLYAFCAQSGCADGANPYASVIDVKGVLFGTTAAGGFGCNGSNGDFCGTVFSLGLGPGAETVVYDFARHADTGEDPSASLIDVNGTLYGTTWASPYDDGTVFSLDLGTRVETVLYRFCLQDHCTDGAYPNANVIAMDGKLYGMTYGGGTGCGWDPGCGTVFSLDPSTGAETVLHSFCSEQNCSDGTDPEGGLIAVGETLYGTTASGGATCPLSDVGCGALFSINPASGAEKVIYSFCRRQYCADGATPGGGLIAVNGTLYGTTINGGGGERVFGAGTVFAFDPNTGERVLYSFCRRGSVACADGANPSAGLIAVNGKFYGTTYGGGAHNRGTVFELQKQR